MSHHSFCLCGDHFEHNKVSDRETGCEEEVVKQSSKESAAIASLSCVEGDDVREIEGYQGDTHVDEGRGGQLHSQRSIGGRRWGSCGNVNMYQFVHTYTLHKSS